MSRSRGRGVEDRQSNEQQGTLENTRPTDDRPSEGERQSKAKQRASDDKAKAGQRVRERVTATALKMLAARPRSERQLRERLLQKPWADPDAVDECIARLKELGYINDSLFARSYANYRVNTRPVGRSRVARELANKKVARETIDDALDGVFDESAEDALIDRAIDKRLRTHGRPEDQAGTKRMFDHLARLGFGYDLIMRKLRAMRARVEED